MLLLCAVALVVDSDFWGDALVVVAFLNAMFSVVVDGVWCSCC